MSGNMNFTLDSEINASTNTNRNRRPGPIPPLPLSTVRSRRQGQPKARNVVLDHYEGDVDALGDDEESSSSFQFDDDESNIHNELWSCKLILSALEDIVFGPNPLNPNIPKEVVHMLKDKVLTLKEELAGVNPFLREEGQVDNDTLNKSTLRDEEFEHYCQTKKNQGFGSNWGLNSGLNYSSMHAFGLFGGGGNSTGVRDLCHRSGKNANSRKYLQNTGLVAETKTVLKNLVVIELKNLGRDIIDIYTPILKKQSRIPNLGNAAVEEEIKRGLEKVNQFLQCTETKFPELNKEIANLRRERQRKVKVLVRKGKEGCLTLNNLEKLVNPENSEAKTARYIEYLNKVNEEAELMIQIKELEKIIQSHPPEVAAEMEKAYARLSAAVEVLEKSCEEKEVIVKKYENLGPAFQELRACYEEQEEEITTKLWVKEQLEMGIADKSFEDSLF